MNYLVLGLDPGLSGGIAALEVLPDGSPGALMVIPMFTKPGPKSGRDVDGLAIANFLNDLNQEIKLAAIELVHSMPKQGVSSSFNFGKGYGKVLGVLESLKIPIHDVTPQRWKKTVLDGLGREKSDAIRYCLNHFPEVDLRATPKCKNHHDGMADAICLAEYARRVLALGPQGPQGSNHGTTQDF